MTSEEQFQKWMDEEVPAIYQGKKVILHRYDTMSEVDEQVARDAWEASRENIAIKLPDFPDFPDFPTSMEREMQQAFLNALSEAAIKVAP